MSHESVFTNDRRRTSSVATIKPSSTYDLLPIVVSKEVMIIYIFINSTTQDTKIHVYAFLYMYIYVHLLYSCTCMCTFSHCVCMYIHVCVFKCTSPLYMFMYIFSLCMNSNVHVCTPDGLFYLCRRKMKILLVKLFILIQLIPLEGTQFLFFKSIIS